MPSPDQVVQLLSEPNESLSVEYKSWLQPRGIAVMSGSLLAEPKRTCLSGQGQVPGSTILAKNPNGQLDRASLLLSGWIVGGRKHEREMLALTTAAEGSCDAELLSANQNQ